MNTTVNHLTQHHEELIIDSCGHSTATVVAAELPHEPLIINHRSGQNNNNNNNTESQQQQQQKRRKLLLAPRLCCGCMATLFLLTTLATICFVLAIAANIYLTTARLRLVAYSPDRITERSDEHSNRLIRPDAGISSDYSGIRSDPFLDERRRSLLEQLDPGVTCDNYPYACWMGALGDKIRNHSLLEITLPGTHDSGAYALMDVVAPHISKRNTLQKFFGNLHKVGLPMFEFLKVWALAQNHTIYQQLNKGIRWLDLRPSYFPPINITATSLSSSSADEDDEAEVAPEEDHRYRVQHFLLGESMPNILKDIRRFLDEQPTEIVVISMGNSERDQPLLADMVERILGPYLYVLPPEESTTGTTLYSATVEELQREAELYGKTDETPTRPLHIESLVGRSTVGQLVSENKRCIVYYNFKKKYPFFGAEAGDGNDAFRYDDDSGVTEKDPSDAASGGGGGGSSSSSSRYQQEEGSSSSAAAAAAAADRLQRRYPFLLNATRVIEGVYANTESTEKMIQHNHKLIKRATGGNGRLVQISWTLTPHANAIARSLLSPFETIRSLYDLAVYHANHVLEEQFRQLSQRYRVGNAILVDQFHTTTLVALLIEDNARQCNDDYRYVAPRPWWDRRVTGVGGGNGQSLDDASQQLMQQQQVNGGSLAQHDKSHFRSCRIWAERGDCDNPQLQMFMHQFCKRSCGLC